MYGIIHFFPRYCSFPNVVNIDLSANKLEVGPKLEVEGSWKLDHIATNLEISRQL